MRPKLASSKLAAIALMAMLVGSVGTRDASAVCNPATCIGTYATTGTYDEQVTNDTNNLMNAVDAIAAGTNVGTTGLVSGGATGLSLMAPDFATAFNNNVGGVVNFDTITDAHEITTFNQFDAAFGADLTFTQTVTRTDSGGGLNTNTNNGVISGHNYLGIQGNAPFTISFSLPLKEFGITALSRGADRTDVMTLTFTDNTTYVFPSETISAANDDTYFGYSTTVAGPNFGKKIASMSWSGLSGFCRWDDFAFVAANFQPGDVNGDLIVDTTDFNIIRDHLGTTGATLSTGDLTGDGQVNLADFEQWKKFYPHPGSGAGAGLASGGAVPEPSSVLLMLLGVAIGLCCRVAKRGRA